jgi:hypothetical protein
MKFLFILMGSGGEPNLVRLLTWDFRPMLRFVPVFSALLQFLFMPNSSCELFYL